MNTARYWHTATLLPNGKVLVAGGEGGNNTAELYNMTNGSWSYTGSMNVSRYLHEAILLPNGKVLVAGGFSSTAELYDPATGKWTYTGSMNISRAEFAAALLSNGKVLAAGGDNNSYGSSAELYDPATGKWTFTGPMNIARGYYEKGVSLLPDGKVLVEGGYAGYSAWLASAEIYDPASGVWTVTGPMNNARSRHAATLLPNGKVLVTAGQNPNDLNSAELFDPATGTWTTTGVLPFATDSHTMTLLPDGQVLVAGGNSPAGSATNAELYNVGLGFSNTWQPQNASITSPLGLGSSLTITGAQFRGIAEGSGGGSQDSSADYPLVQLRSLESGRTVFLSSTTGPRTHSPRCRSGISRPAGRWPRCSSMAFQVPAASSTSVFPFPPSPP